MSRLQEYYKDTVVPGLKEKLSLDNVMEVPRITKITLNMGKSQLPRSRFVTAGP
jgi:large subunit ribosomal protein L5